MIFRRLSIITSALIPAILWLSSCSKQEGQDQPTPTASTVSEMKVPTGFKFATASESGIQIATLDNINQPIPNIRIDIFTDYPDNGGRIIMSGVTDVTGKFSTTFRFPDIYDSLVVSAHAVGFVNMQKVAIQNNLLSLTLGGSQSPSLKNGETGSFKSVNSVFYPLGNYNSSGVPTYLTPVNDVIDASMLADINSTLPEYISLPNNHPDYFGSNIENSLVMSGAGDVYVTFIHEGANYRNVLGFYSYPANNPPASVNDIDTVKIIFPNASFSGSGGGLATGNRVFLGNFPPNTEIGWVLIADGFRSGNITNGNWILYSDPQFNPETDPAKKKHSVLLNDVGRGRFILAFEDQRRDGTTDNDFNDAIFYVTVDPVQAVNPANLPVAPYTQTDTDGDGISDIFDDYPTDPTKAFNNYYPSQNSVGSLAYEDLWPAKGDYDFNDMVVDYNFNQVTNAQNHVVEIKAKLILKAMGASFKNGFGIQMEVPSAQVASVSGSRLFENLVTLNANGTEAGQSKATAIVFDNGFKILPHPGFPSVGVNTTPGAPYVQPDTINLLVTLASAVPISVIGTPPYNPFLIVNQDRGREVHLAGYPSTALANPALFGTVQDDSNPSIGRYYVTENNLCWAIDVAGPFSYPKEKVDISQAYTKFIPWGESGGVVYYDWYLNKPGYRNPQHLYNP